VIMPVPRPKGRHVRRIDAMPVLTWLVVVAEVDGPKGVKPIDRVPRTSPPVEGFEQAMVVVSHHEKRRLIEGYFKAPRSGRRVTERRLKTKGRLGALVGLLSAVAARLLPLKAHARAEPDRRAVEVVPPRHVDLLKSARGLGRATTPGAGRFYGELAVVGGFLLGAEARRRPGLDHDLARLGGASADDEGGGGGRGARPLRRGLAGKDEAYSPDLDPIERLFSKLKAYLRSAAARTVAALIEAKGEALREVRPGAILGWFGHGGYRTSTSTDTLDRKLL